MTSMLFLLFIKEWKKDWGHNLKTWEMHIAVLRIYIYIERERKKERERVNKL